MILRNWIGHLGKGQMESLYCVLHFMELTEIRIHCDCAVFWPASGSCAVNLVNFIFSEERKEAQFNLCLHKHIKAHVLIHSYSPTSNALGRCRNGHVLSFIIIFVCATERPDFHGALLDFRGSLAFW